jgi:hypothetical protein
MTEVALPSFSMYGAREASANGLGHIEQQVRSLELAVQENPSLAFDLAKTIVESVCKAVLEERGLAYDARDDLPKLFREVRRSLPFLPESAAGEVDARRSLEQTMSGLGTALQGICELRNRYGFASHGSGSARAELEGVQALLAAQAADAIIGFIHRVHRQSRTPKGTLPSYVESTDFNDSVDDAYGLIRIFELEFRPSEVLYQLEPESYRIYLGDFVARALVEAEAAEVGEVDE